MAETLQEKFIESKGQPVLVGQQQVIQMDLIPIRSGNITVRFLSEPIGIYGVVLKSYKGSITLSDGSKVPSVFVWNELGLDREVRHPVECPDGELGIWNIYRTTHPTGETTEDYFTGNAGMIVNRAEDKVRHYLCSAGPGPFDPEQFQFEVCW